jgi:hypothetical protein
MRNGTPGIGERPCILVCHSLGGLLAKRILLEARKSGDLDRFRHENVAALMFLGTPHRGAGLANVLKTVSQIKEVVLRRLLPLFGADTTDFGPRVLTTTKLIEELERGGVDLQRLNERFVLYFAERQSLDPLRVRVYMETELLRLAGVPAAIVVDHDSADPNLAPNAGVNAIPPVAVPGADHSTLAKPSSRDSQVCKGLDKLIEQVAVETGVFDLNDPLRNEVGRMIFLALRQRPRLLQLGALVALVGAASSAPQARALAERLALREGAELLDGLSQVRRALAELASLTGAEAPDVAAMERVAGALVLLALGRPEGVVPAAADTPACSEFEIPIVDGLEGPEAEEFLDFVVEVRHAVLRRWPSRWQISDDGSVVSPGSWIMKSAALSHPSSWHERDHVDHLIDRINASSPQGSRPKGAVLASGPAGAGLPAPASAEAVDAGASAGQPEGPVTAMDRMRRTKAQRLLRVRLSDQIGLVIAATQPNCPYRSATLRARVAELFGSLVAVALPAPGETETGDLIERVAELQVEIQQFMIVARSAQTRVQNHAH